MKMGIPITARYPKVRADWIYLFNDTEIMRVKVMPRTQLAAVVIAYVVLVFVIGVPALLFLPTILGLPIILVLFGVGIIFPYLIHSLRQRQVSSLSIEDAANRSSTMHIAWSSVSSAELEGYTLKLRADSTKYRIYLFDPDADSISNLVMSKLGDRLTMK